jgi:hypothetical protein
MATTLMADIAGCSMHYQPLAFADLNNINRPADEDLQAGAVEDALNTEFCPHSGISLMRTEQQAGIG